MAGFKAKQSHKSDIAYHIEQAPTLCAGNMDGSIVIKEGGGMERDSSDLYGSA